MLEQRIQQHFIDSADLKYQAAQSLTKPIVDAIQAVLACVTSGGKVLACGNGGSAADALNFSSRFVGRFERDRPELAAVALSADTALITGTGTLNDFSQVYARQVRALGQAGDVLLALSVDGQCANVLAAVEAAHERDMSVVALTGHGGGRLAQALRETDVNICAPHDRAPRIHEVHLLALNCLCDGVDSQLLGDLEQEPSP